MNIEQKPVKSFQSRNGHLPIAIVNHISTGTMGSMYNTFANFNNKASSNFGISRKGEIVQYVDIKNAAWTQGKIQFPTSPLIKQMMGNPNQYCVSIEHEGYPDNGIEGDLTEEQFIASCWLHKWIQEEVRRTYGTTFELNGHTVIGHYQIDSKGKPLCPGLKFPWSNLYSELIHANQMSLVQYQERLDYKNSIDSNKVLAYAFVSRVENLRSKLTHEGYAKEADRKLLLLTPILDVISYSSYFTEVTANNIAQRVRDIYNNSMIVKYEESAIKKLLVAASHAQDKGMM